MRIWSTTTTSLRPDNALSFDVLEQILLFCAPGPCTFPPNRLDPHLVITQVCSAWRNTAFGSTRLWRALSITDKVEVVGWKPASKFAKEWLSRTPSSNLSLFVFRTACNPHFLHEIIMAHSSRFKKIQIFLKTSDQLEEMLNTPFESLRSLWVPQWFSVTPLSLLGNMGIFPSLRHLSLTLARPRVYFPSISQFPLRNLLILRLRDGYITISDCHGLLLSCPFLKRCEFKISRGSTATNNSAIHHVHLKECILTLGTDPGGVERLFEPLILPHLERLRFTSPESWSWTTLVRLFQRSACRIQKLWITTWSYGGIMQDMEALLSELPHLVEFYLPELDMGVRNGELLRKIGTGEYLPQLRRLYTDMPRDGAAVDRLLDMVKQRAPGKLEAADDQVSSIRELWCTTVHHLDGERNARLLELRGKGVMIGTSQGWEKI